MSGTQMKASLLLTLDDRLSGGLKALTDALDRISRASEALAGALDRVSRASEALGGALEGALTRGASNAQAATREVGALETRVSGLGGAAERVGKQLDGMFGRLEHGALARAGGRVMDFAREIGPIGGVAAGYGLLEPTRKYADFENVVRHIAITEGRSGADVQPRIDALTKMFAEDAQRTGQSSESIAKAFLDLVSTGIPGSIIDRVIAAHSRAATAYNISPEALGPAVGALLQNFKVPEEDIGAALAAMAQASKEGRFKVEDFSRELPGVAGVMALLGMGGRGGADYGFAALETVMKNSSNPSQASAGFVDALRYITDNAGRNAFKREGIDLPDVLAQGARNGRNPLDAVLDLLDRMTKGMDPVRQAETLGGLLHNQQAALAIQALLQHRPEFEALRGKLGGVDPAQVQRDFDAAFQGPITSVRLFDENLQQAARTAGELFNPALKNVSDTLGGVRDGFSWMHDNFPEMTRRLGDVSGNALLAVTALGALGVVVPAVTAGLSALGAVVAVLAAPEALAVAAAGGIAAGIAYLAQHPDAATFALGPGKHPALEPTPKDESLLERIGRAARETKDAPRDDAPLVKLHVTAAPGLDVRASEAPGRGVLLRLPDAAPGRAVGRE